MQDFDKINQEILTFVKDRDWEKFHSPKNLSMALTVEASELLEIFQWQKESDIFDSKINDVIVQDTKDEVADIFYYLLRICQKMDINLEEAFWDKMKKNKIKYPVEDFKGKSTKY